MSSREIEQAIEVLRRVTSGTDEELGAVHACLLDVPEGVAKLLKETVPRLTASQTDLERLLDCLVEFKLELDHLRGHVVDASEALQSLSNRVENRLPRKERRS